MNKINISFDGFFVNLFMIFLVLKLTNLIDWSWLWITAPLWIPLSIIAIIVIIIFIYSSFIKLVKTIKNKRKKKENV